ncbi:hypothetical protein B0H19DRAFT_1070188 [Mycena capillaripes]|nr:hypothetical protein B0H19DRAFT_1070188 [Mycena capillaripes]
MRLPCWCGVAWASVVGNTGVTSSVEWRKARRETRSDIPQSRVTEGVDGVELWSMSRVTAAVDKYVGASRKIDENIPVREGLQIPSQSLTLLAHRFSEQDMPPLRSGNSDEKFELNHGVAGGVDCDMVNRRLSRER